MDWIDLAEERDMRPAVVKAVMNLLRKDSGPWSR